VTLLLLDTNVLAYAVGTEHELRGPARVLLLAAAEGAVQITTTALVIQEFLHVRAARRPRADAVALSRDFARACDPLLRVEADDLELGFALFARDDELDAFDSLLAAVAIRSGVDALVSADQAFAAVDGLTWMDLATIDLGGT